jgi:hypothetical protein
MTKAQHEAAMEKQRLELTALMECGHPVAALNQTRPRPRGFETTMYCRSCEIQTRKENRK